MFVYCKTIKNQTVRYIVSLTEKKAVKRHLTGALQRERKYINKGGTLIKHLKRL